MAQRMQSPSIHCCPWTGPCVTVDTVENVNRSQCLVMQQEREVCEACQTASLCPFVWVVFFKLLLGVMELWHVTSHHGERYLSTSLCWTQYETISNFYGFRSQILICHFLLAYIKVRTRSDQTTCLTSSYCIMLFFVNVTM